MATPGFGETLQAVGGHRFADVLDDPGESDLSAHVDFARPGGSGAAWRRGGPAGRSTQGEFLAQLGIVQRAEQSDAQPIRSAAPKIAQAAIERLIGPEQMGTLFKALAIVPHDGAEAAGLLTMNILQRRQLSKSPGIAHGFFGRTGGVSQGIFASLNCGPGSGDDARAMWPRIAAALPSALGADAQLVTLSQIHSAECRRRSPRLGHRRARPQGDAMVTNVPGIALGILTADCAPVLFADAEARVIGAAHAGWKGALGGRAGSDDRGDGRAGRAPERIAAAIGPCISQANYEVGAEFRDRFLRSRLAQWPVLRAERPRRTFPLRSGGLCRAPARRSGRRQRRATVAPAPMRAKAISSASAAPPIAASRTMAGRFRRLC